MQTREQKLTVALHAVREATVEFLANPNAGDLAVAICDALERAGIDITPITDALSG